MSTPTPHSFFDQEKAASYDTRFAKLSPIGNALHLLAAGVLAPLPADARVLCVGAGTGAEILALAEYHPGWRFVAVEPSGAMLDLCRRKLVDAGVADRCEFHEGYLDSLPATELFEAATAILVSHFLVELDQRRAFFLGIAERLMDGGMLVSVDLSAGESEEIYLRLFEVWKRLFGIAGMEHEQIAKFAAAYGKDVALSSPGTIEELIASAGFEEPVAFFQAVLMRGWFATKMIGR